MFHPAAHHKWTWSVFVLKRYEWHKKPVLTVWHTDWLTGTHMKHAAIRSFLTDDLKMGKWGQAFFFFFLVCFLFFVCLSVWFFFFFFLLFTFQNHWHLFWGYQNGNFLPGKSISHRKKFKKNDFAPSEKYSSYAPAILNAAMVISQGFFCLINDKLSFVLCQGFCGMLSFVWEKNNMLFLLDWEVL